MEIGEVDDFAADVEAVIAVFVGDEVEWHLTHALGIGDGILPLVFGEIDVSVAMTEVELAQLVVFIEGDDGIVQNGVVPGTVFGKGNVEAAFSSICLGVLGKGDSFSIRVFGLNHDTRARQDGSIIFHNLDAVAFIVYLVVEASA